MYYPGAVSTPGKLDYHLMIITTNLHINGTVHQPNKFRSILSSLEVWTKVTFGFLNVLRGRVTNLGNFPKFYLFFWWLPYFGHSNWNDPSSKGKGRMRTRGQEGAAPAFLGKTQRFGGFLDPCDQNETYHTSNEDKIEHMNKTWQVESPFKYSLKLIFK